MVLSLNDPAAAGPAREPARSGPARAPRGRVIITAELCKGCGFCVRFCPTQVLVLAPGFNAKGYHPPEVVRAEACSGCDLCGMYCPDFAIFGVRLKPAA